MQQDQSDSNKLIDLLYNFDKTEWTKFTEIFPNLNEYVAKALPSIEKANYFLGMDLATAPAQQLWPGVLIPILAGLTQWLSSKMMQTDNGSKNSDDTMGSTMKTMNIMMPLMSVFFCFYILCRYRCILDCIFCCYDSDSDDRKQVYGAH